MKAFIAAAVLVAAFAVSAGTETPVAKVGCESVSVSAGFTNAVVKLRNDGATDAVEVVQIYVSTPNSGKGAHSEDGSALGDRSSSTAVDAKPRLLFFRSERCRRCIRLEKELFSTQKWFDFAEGRITLERVDMGGIDEHPLAARYGVDRKGTFVLTSADDGREAARLEACEDPAAVIPWLRGAIDSGD